MLPPLSSSQEQLISAARLLKKAERVVSRMPSRQSNGTILVKLKQTYQDGRIATQRIVQHSCPEAFHELRKMTKQFYYQCQFVASALDRELQAEIDQARSLADKLGDALDLCVLTSNLASASQKGDESEIFAVINESQLQMATLSTSPYFLHIDYFSNLRRHSDGESRDSEFASHPVIKHCKPLFGFRSPSNFSDPLHGNVSQVADRRRAISVTAVLLDALLNKLSTTGSPASSETPSTGIEDIMHF